jgi:hypothetical protein
LQDKLKYKIQGFRFHEHGTDKCAPNSLLGRLLAIIHEFVGNFALPLTKGIRSQQSLQACMKGDKGMIAKMAMAVQTSSYGKNLSKQIKVTIATIS